MRLPLDFQHGEVRQGFRFLYEFCTRNTPLQTKDKIHETGSKSLSAHNNSFWKFIFKLKVQTTSPALHSNKSLTPMSFPTRDPASGRYALLMFKLLRCIFSLYKSACVSRALERERERESARSRYYQKTSDANSKQLHFKTTAQCDMRMLNV